MFKSFFTITIRSLFRQGVFPIINVLGLSIGLAVVLLISLLIFKDMSFDKTFKEGKNIYRINAVTDVETFTSSANKTGPAMRELPEVVTTVRTINRVYDMLCNENSVNIRVVWADEDFFRLFDTPFIVGTPEDVMSRPSAIAISEKEAKRLFGDSDPIGQTIVHTIWRNVPPMEVVAVFKNYPENSSLKDFSIIAPFMHCHEAVIYRQETWIRDEFETFCLLTANADIKSVNAKMQKIVSDATAGEQGIVWRPQLQRFTDIHLHSAKYIGFTSLSAMADMGRVKMLLLLSVIILLVACVNYMNLSTARAQKRSREIGISKTIGATRAELVTRLSFETAIFTFASFIVAFILARGLLPVFNSLTNEHLNFGIALQALFLSVALLIWIITTILAAAYPALFISGFPPLMAIQSQSMPKSTHATVRKILIVGQFAVAIVLITWVLVIQTQIKFANNKDLGFNPNNLIGFWIHDSNPTSLLDDFRALSSVEMLSRENRSSAFGVSDNTLYIDPDDQTGFRLKVVCADPDYIDLMQIKLIAGSHYQKIETQRRDTVVNGNSVSYMTIKDNDYNTYVILNRAAVDYLGMTPEEVIGQRINAKIDDALHPNSPVIVSGVVENFHFESLHRPIGGFCVHYGLNNHKRFLVVRVNKGNLPEQLKSFEEIYKRYFPNNPFVPEFIDRQVADRYDGERRTGRIAVVFSLLAIFVACMGVFGLTAFMAEQRTKEIGIRKVMGASVMNIVGLFTSSYMKLLLISLVIAIPIAWWVCDRYLQNFAYRISLSWWIFALAALITVALTLFTVSVLAIKAAMANPVKSIKTD